MAQAAPFIAAAASMVSAVAPIVTGLMSKPGEPPKPPGMDDKKTQAAAQAEARKLREQRLAANSTRISSGSMAFGIEQTGSLSRPTAGGILA